MTYYLFCHIRIIAPPNNFHVFTFKKETDLLNFIMDVDEYAPNMVNMELDYEEGD
jgi:hypothetical protein